MGAARRRNVAQVIRTRPGPELESFAAIYERLSRREPLTSADQRKLERLLKQLLSGAEVGHWFYAPVEGRPPNDEFALFIAADVELRRLPGSRLKTAIGSVAAAWQLPDALVARRHRLARADARAWIARSPSGAVAAVVSWQRERLINSH